jgi:thiol-disulfide isomerase/thioredoxin
MNQPRLSIATLAATLFALVGCSDTTAKQGSGLPGSTSPPAASPPTAALSLRVIDERQLASEIERHRGKVVLVDFWATWCPECLKLMPHTVELQKALGDRLAVILISVDSPEDDQEIVRQSLARNGVTFDSYVSRYGGSPRSAEAFDIESAALPNVRVYDRAGALRKVFSAGHVPPEPFEAEDVEKTVRDLGAEEP